jgi:hypothetical protein
MFRTVLEEYQKKYPRKCYEIHVYSCERGLDGWLMFHRWLLKNDKEYVAKTKIIDLVATIGEGIIEEENGTEEEREATRQNTKCLWPSSN